jgi:hypothetical protein
MSGYYAYVSGVSTHMKEGGVGAPSRGWRTPWGGFPLPYKREALLLSSFTPCSTSIASSRCSNVRHGLGEALPK